MIANCFNAARGKFAGAISFSHLMQRYMAFQCRTRQFSGAIRHPLWFTFSILGFNAARGNLLVQSRHALPASHMGRDGVLESHGFFRHTLLTQEKHTLQNHDVNPCFPFCDAVYTNLESANDRIQLCRSIAALSIFPAP